MATFYSEILIFSRACQYFTTVKLVKAFSSYANPAVIIRLLFFPVLLSTLADDEALWFSLFSVYIF